MQEGWSDIRERGLALKLGECLQTAGWKTPYFIPADQVVAVIAGPSFGTYLQQDLAYLLDEFNRRLGRGVKREFFCAVIDWSDPSACFGELAGRVKVELEPNCEEIRSEGWGGFLQ